MPRARYDVMMPLRVQSSTHAQRCPEYERRPVVGTPEEVSPSRTQTASSLVVRSPLALVPYPTSQPLHRQANHSNFSIVYLLAFAAQ